MRWASSLSDTIVAPATAPGTAALAIVRLSGPQAAAIAAALSAPLPLPKPHRLARRQLHDAAAQPLDDAMLVHMPGPRSYTGDDVVEFHLHGAAAVVQAVLAACLAAGARMAQPGEFTARAHLNGRLDLAQAEAVADLINAQDASEARAALQQLQGGLRSALTPILEVLQDLLTDWRAALDFPDVVAGELEIAGCSERLRGLAAQLAALAGGRRRAASGRPRVVLWGPTNAGKSTLFNAWCGEARVLVDPSPGTTRDPVSVEMGDGPVGWTLCDLAGLRVEATGLEARGVAMARGWASSAQLILWLVRADAADWPPAGLGPLWVVGSQGDRATSAQRAQLEMAAGARGLAFAGWIAAPLGEGLAALRAAVESHLLAAADAPGTVGAAKIQVTMRQHEGLLAAHRELLSASEGLLGGRTLDMLTAEVEAAARQLGQLLGKDIDAELLDRVFARFCIGK